MPFHHAPGLWRPVAVWQVPVTGRAQDEEADKHDGLFVLCSLFLVVSLDVGGLAGRMEATSGFEPLDRGFADPRLNLLATSPVGRKNGAEDGIRTRDLLLGKETRYHCATSARRMVPRVRIELTTPQFSAARSTD